MEYKIKSRIWIEAGDNVLVGEGRIRLLKAIEETGSLSKAAKTLKMSYRKAWLLVDAINKTGEQPIVSSSIGGKNGGGTIVTGYGKEIIATFEKINQNCWKFLEQQSNQIKVLQE
ncbi:MAG: winged helix-turn-helix domain-containing protein [Flavobacteriales bacterium]|nr:winged helix-turn-helix domain-containing protein [Flavobacteriales bacterium]